MTHFEIEFGYRRQRVKGHPKREDGIHVYTCMIVGEHVAN